MAEVSDEANLFTGAGSTNECAEFVRSIRAHAFAQGKMRDDEWMADYASTRMTDAAGVWFEYLEEEIQTSWKLLRRALMDQFAMESPSSRSFIPTPAAVTPASHQESYPSVGKYGSTAWTPAAVTRRVTNVSMSSSLDSSRFSDLIIRPESSKTAIKNRVALLMEILPGAFSLGTDSEGDSGGDLKNLDNQDIVFHFDTATVFNVQKDPSLNRRYLFQHVSNGQVRSRYNLDGLQDRLRQVADLRVRHVKNWLDANIGSFPADNPGVHVLRRAFQDSSQILRSNLQLCLAECNNCRLRCILHKEHVRTDHDCGTSHICSSSCSFPEEHDDDEDCGLPAEHEGRHMCDGAAHTCGQPCHLGTKRGCQNFCSLPPDHMEDEHFCCARLHQCGEPCSVREMPLKHLHEGYSCSGLCSKSHDEVHTRHSCDNRFSCPIKCTLCQLYCTIGDHFHGFEAGALHLCGQEHLCDNDCKPAGIYETNTTSHPVRSTFTNRHNTFQYSKYTQTAKRLTCTIVIPSDKLVHTGPHVHSQEMSTFRYCEEACIHCDNICTLPLGHSQREHETAHGLMDQTAWRNKGMPHASAKVKGRSIGEKDGNIPQLCSSACHNIGRHAHVDYCRNLRGDCQEPGLEHIDDKVLPNPDRPKDWISHRVFWARSGFKDPYSMDEQAEFSLCDAQCSGPEHQATGFLSFCTLPLFHPPQPLLSRVRGKTSYVSSDGHAFDCPDPNILSQKY